MSEDEAECTHVHKTQTLLNLMPDPVVIVDAKGKILLINDKVEEVTGFKKEELLGKNFLMTELVTVKSKAILMKNLAKRMMGTHVAPYEIEAITKDDEKLPFEVNARKIEYKGKQADLVVFRDINERKHLQEKLLRTEKLAAIGQLVASIGHELRNRIGVINNSSYFLNMKLKDIADEKIMKHLKIVEREVNFANKIISDLLDFAREKPPTLQETDLNHVVMSALSDASIPENIKVTTELGEIPSMLLDQEQIRRVFQNMILNAVQAMLEDGKLIIQTSKHDDSAEISFKDTGVGIPKENMSKLFTPLFSTKAKGVGLGLTICKQIVEGHGGNITVKSKVGEGSTFTVRLPIERRIKSEE